MSVPGSSWRNWDEDLPEQPPTEQDQESVVDPQSKLQPNESLALAGQVKYRVFALLSTKGTVRWGAMQKSFDSKEQWYENSGMLSQLR